MTSLSRRLFVVIGLIAGAGSFALAAPTSSTQHGAATTDFNANISNTDLIAGAIATELAGDLGWHPANPAATNGSLDPDGLPAFTDGDGLLASGLTGLLQDFPGAGAPAKRIQYDFPAADIDSIRILTGNAGADGRVFSTTVVSYETANSGSFNTLGYFQSDPSGTINSGRWQSTFVTIEDDGAGLLATNVTALIFEFYAVDNTGGEMRDPFDGVNPFNGVDDGLTAAFVAPLVWEIDVLGRSTIIPEPASAALLGLAALMIVRRGRQSV